MAARRKRAGGLAVIAAALTLAVGSPADAHEGEKHTPPAAAKQSTDPGAADHDMSDMDTPATEMEWPTADDMQGMAAHEARPTTFAGRLVRWLGAWHPAVVHFPVALLLTVAFLELAAAVRRRPIYSAANKILLAVAALSAFAAAPLGWIAAGLPSPDDKFALTVHRWLGTAIPFLILLLWALKKPADGGALGRKRYYEALLAASVPVIVTQAYFGAVVTHGAEHLAF
jgi:uncharacterized membrane protein